MMAKSKKMDIPTMSKSSKPKQTYEGEVKAILMKPKAKRVK